MEAVLYRRMGKNAKTIFVPTPTLFSKLCKLLTNNDLQLPQALAWIQRLLPNSLIKDRGNSRPGPGLTTVVSR